MILTCSRLGTVRALLLTVALVACVGNDGASAQLRRRMPEPPPAPEPIPEIIDETARCSFAFHDALAGLRDAKAILRFESQSRIVEKGLTGRWLFWAKSGKAAVQSPITEDVCIEFGNRAGRQRCTKWEAKRIEPPLPGAQPTKEELAVLRALDSFVIDKGAALEFGPNGRQFATLQRVASEIGSYSAQPRHPALCNGVPEMLDFHAGNLSGLKKRINDVNELARKAATLARLRVNAARDQRVAEAPGGDGAVARDTAAAAATPEVSVGAKRSIAPLAAVPADVTADGLVLLALESLVSAEQAKVLAGEVGAVRRLQMAREILATEALPEVSAAARASAGAALRMVEATAYGELQVARMSHFDGMFHGVIDQIHAMHRANCTCGN